MPRSLKKGPFVDDHLLKKVDVLNETGDSLRARSIKLRPSPAASASMSGTTSARPRVPNIVRRSSSRSLLRP